MRRSITIAALLLPIVVLAACTDGGDSGGAVDLGGDRIDAQLAGLGDGAEPIDLATLRGAPVVVNFFASTCAPCVREMPALERVHLAAGDAVTFVGVAVNDRVDDALALVEQTGVTYLLAADPQGEFFRSAGGSAVVLPSTLVLDADGRVGSRLIGEIEADELVEHLAEVGVDVELT